MKLPVGRLFWKCFAVLWLAMVAAFVCAGLYMRLSGHAPPPPPSEPSRWLFLIPVLSGAAVGLPVAFALAWYLAKPLHHLSMALRHAARARFDVRVLPLLGSRRDELVELAREFDHMAALLQQAAAQHRQLFHDVSHELRSPLARIQAAVGLMQQNPQSGLVMAERIAREAEQLDRLIEELLTLHKLEAGAIGPVRERVDVMELLTDIAQDAAFEAQARACAVTLDAPGSFVAEVAGETLYSAFENVVRNAVKYTATNTTVEIHAQVSAPPNPDGGDVKWLEVSVCDRGPGVPAELCETIFEPFRRLEPHRHEGAAQAVPGTGLGLAIAQRALALHGGSIRAMPRAGGGLCVTARLPSAVTSAPASEHL